MNLSVIIPVYNEGSNIKRCLESIKRLQPLEIIVSDGGSSDDTCILAQEAGAKIVHSPKGRGTQLNAAALRAKGDILWFIHADACLPEDLNPDYLQSTIHNGYAGGFFRLRFNDNSPSLRVVEFFANLRSRLFHLPYGDQAIFVKRDIFEKAGGFRKYPFLEDLDFILRLKKAYRLKYIPVSITVSARRLKKGYFLSPIFVSLRNVFIAALFMLGVKPDKLIFLYK